MDWEDRRWDPDKARLKIYEGPALRPEELGQGRGWANATRSGIEVTADLLGEAQRESARNPILEALKAELIALAADHAVDMREAVRLAGALQTGSRPSEQLALAEQAVWELLHKQAATLLVVEEGEPAAATPEQWRTLLLAWGTWTGDGGRAVLLEAPTRR